MLAPMPTEAFAVGHVQVTGTCTAWDNATGLVQNMNIIYTLNSTNDEDWFYFETEAPNELVYLHFSDFETDYSNGISGAVYDSAVPELVFVQAGNLLEGALFRCNPYFSENSTRISFAATKALGTSGTVCLPTFQVRETAPLGPSDVLLANIIKTTWHVT